MTGGPRPPNGPMRRSGQSRIARSSFAGPPKGEFEVRRMRSRIRASDRVRRARIRGRSFFIRGADLRLIRFQLPLRIFLIFVYFANFGIRRINLLRDVFFRCTAA